MATITKIEQQKNKARVNIFVDDAFFCGLNKETAILFKLKPGQEIDEAEIQKALEASEVKSAFEKASDYLSSRMHSKKELFDKLVKKGYEKDIASKAIEKLEEYHYIDDSLFAKEFILQNSKLSKKMLENKLFSKGVANDIIQNELKEKSDDEEIELCETFAKKYIKSKDINKENGKQKMFASLMRKGFSFETIKKATKNILSSEDIEI